MTHSWLFIGCSSVYISLRPPSICPLHSPPPENHSAPPDVTGYSSDSSHSHTERHHMSNMGTIARNTQKYGNAERMETGDGKTHRLCCHILSRLPTGASNCRQSDKNRNFNQEVSSNWYTAVENWPITACLLLSLPWMSRLDVFKGG